MEKGKVVSLEDRIPKLKQRRKKKANRRAIFLLSFFFLLLILVLYFLSPLSNIGSVSVKGNQYVTDEGIIEASGLSSDTSIWKMKSSAVEDRIKALPEVKKADVSIKLPNKVVIKVEEYNRLGYLVKNAKYYPILSSGNYLDPLDKGEVPIHAPLLIGFKKGKELKSMVDALSKLPEEINNAISEIHYEPVKSDKYHIRMYMNDGYEVTATSKSVADKLIHYPAIVAQLDPKIKGVIHLEVGSYFEEYKSSSKLSDDQEEKDREEGKPPAEGNGEN
ncbi:cell division protein FtsQ/DivIB [Bacillus testis]|uniref:cell division protein FtsQ/DivIB n=1 Tax=Bacillus testis TaxID=1622072 RepID=UPI00067F10A5|nr:FtsQ-type POTRA domain-containing protein [Bacillus testis]